MARHVVIHNLLWSMGGSYCKLVLSKVCLELLEEMSLPEELNARTKGGRKRWWLLVQRAKRSLQQRGEVAGKRHWRITNQGLQRARAEDMPIQLVFSLAAP